MTLWYFITHIKVSCILIHVRCLYCRLQCYVCTSVDSCMQHTHQWHSSPHMQVTSFVVLVSWSLYGLKNERNSSLCAIVSSVLSLSHTRKDTSKDKLSLNVHVRPLSAIYHVFIWPLNMNSFHPNRKNIMVRVLWGQRTFVLKWENQNRETTHFPFFVFLFLKGNLETARFPVFSFQNETPLVAK